jgi:hypothetical protein
LEIFQIKKHPKDNLIEIFVILRKFPFLPFRDGYSPLDYLYEVFFQADEAAKRPFVYYIYPFNVNFDRDEWKRIENFLNH